MSLCNHDNYFEHEFLLPLFGAILILKFEVSRICLSCVIAPRAKMTPYKTHSKSFHVNIDPKLIGFSVEEYTELTRHFNPTKICLIKSGPKIFS